jgi:hypothetical protein
MTGKGRILGIPRARSRGPLITAPPQEDVSAEGADDVEGENELKDNAISEMEEEMLLKEPSSAEQMFVNYISKMASHIGMTKEEFARSPQARNYARKLGIEDDVYELS